MSRCQQEAHYVTVQLVMGAPAVTYNLLLRTDGSQDCRVDFPEITLLLSSALLSF